MKINQIRRRPLTTVALVVQISLSVYSQQQSLPSAVVVEATSTMRGIGNYVDQRLWVRLTKDGKMEWEEPVLGKPNELHSAQVSPKQLGAIEQDLNSIDWGKVHGQMGPYNIYIDTSVEVRIHAATTAGDRQVAIVNPWPGSHQKPLPIELKRILCQLDALHAQATGQPTQKMCIGTPISVH
jgi:hypothetical protein